MKRVTSIITALRNDGRRITQARRCIAAALCSATGPIAPLELHERLRKQGTIIDKVTVYRELKMLHAAGIVALVQLRDDVARYELVPSHGHKHHLVCTECKHIRNIDMECSSIHAVERSIGIKNRFKILGHSLEFYGLCPKCQ